MGKSERILVDCGNLQGYILPPKPDAANRDFAGRIREYSIEEDSIIFGIDTYLGNTAAVKISFATETVYRLEMFPFERTDVRRNSVFNFPAYCDFTVSEDDLFIYAATSRVKLIIRKCPWEVVTYLDGKELCKEQIRDFNCGQEYKAQPLGFSYDLETKKVQSCWETGYMYSDEAFYGFGEKFTEFNKRGQTIDIWQRDSLSTNSDLSYKAMPYFMSSNGYSVLLNTFTRPNFNMGTTSEVSYTMTTPDPYIDYYVFCNRSFKGLIRDYTALSGRSDMIPKWAFGFWMSKMSYLTRDEVESVVSKAQEFGMSMDVIHIDAWESFGKEEILEFDEDRFPNPKEMIEGLNKKGVQLSCWMYPYVSKYIPDYVAMIKGGTVHKTLNPAFEKLGALGYLVKNKQGETCEFVPMEQEGEGVVSAAIDFTNPDAKAYVQGKIHQLMELGVGVIKTDFSEEIPEEAVFYDGGTGLSYHNKYPLLYAETIYEASRDIKEKKGQKALLWGRSGYAGSQNYPANWAGDSSADKNNTAAILRGGLSMGISGVSFWGFDIGGFYNSDYEGNRAKPEESDYIRSIQMGLLSPLSRSHGQATPREPWEYSEAAQKAFLKIERFRYRLFPYLYSIAQETHREGIPMMRAMLLEFQEDLNTREISTQYMLGGALLVAPVFDQLVQHVYLPRGSWINFNTGERTEGGVWTSEDCALDELPLYLREDTILPLLNKASLHSPENFFTDYSVHMNLVHTIDSQLFSDNTIYTCSARKEGEAVLIKTTMDCTDFVIYSPFPFSKAIVNGKNLPVTQDLMVAGKYTVCRRD